MSGRLISPKTLGLNIGNFGTDFESSRTDLRTGNGPCMLLLYVMLGVLITCKLCVYMLFLWFNNMLFVNFVNICMLDILTCIIWKWHNAFHMHWGTL